MIVNFPQLQAFMIFILLIVDVLCFCYHLKNEENVESYIKDLTEKFGKDAGDTVFFWYHRTSCVNSWKEAGFLISKNFPVESTRAALCSLYAKMSNAQRDCPKTLEVDKLLGRKAIVADQG